MIHSVHQCSLTGNKLFYAGVLHLWATVSKSVMSEGVNETERRTDGARGRLTADGTTESGKMMAIKAEICERN